MRPVHHRLAAPIVLLGSSLVAQGCSESSLALDGGGMEDVAGAEGVATVVFAGTDAATLTTDVWAFGPSGAFNVTGGLRSLLAEGSSVLPSTAPLPVPSWDGSRLALVVTEVDSESGEVIVSPATCSLDGVEAEVGEPVPGLIAAWFDQGGEHLVLQVQDSGADTRRVLFLPADLSGEPVQAEIDATDVVFRGHAGETGHVLVTATADGDATRSVWRVDPHDGAASLLAADPERWLGAPSVSPDGAWLAVEASDATGRRELYAWSLDDGRVVAISAGSPLVDAHHPAWDPGSAGAPRLAWVEDPVGGGTPGSTVRVLDVLGGDDGARTLVGTEDLPTGRTVDSLRWSPAGGRLLVISRSADLGTGEISYELQVVSAGESDGGSDDDAEFTAGDVDEIDSGGTPLNPSTAHWARDGSRVLLWDRAAATATPPSSPVRELDPDSMTLTDVGTDFAGEISYPLYAWWNTLLYP